MNPNEQQSVDEIVTDLAKMDRSALVVRHNKIIESRHSLSLTEQRFLLWIISQIKKEDKTLKTYRVAVKHWEEFCGLKPTDNPYKAAMALVDKLTTRNVAILDDKRQRYTTRPWFLRATYAYGEGYIEVRLNDDLQDMFLELSRNYTAISLEYALLLNSAYAGRIYDLLKQYLKIGERIINLDDMRSMLEIQDKYTLFSDIRRNILEVSEREINEKTDIRFTWEPIKEGRKVTAIHFFIEPNNPTVTLDSPETKDPSVKRLRERLLGHGVSEKAATDLVADYESDRVEWHISELERQLEAGQAIPSPAGWLRKGIREDYRPQKSLFQKEQEKAAKERKAQRLREAKTTDAADELERFVTLENRRRVREKIDQFSDQERASFDKQFLAAMAEGTGVEQEAGQKFKVSGRKDVVANLQYETFVRLTYPDILVNAVDLAQERGESEQVLAEIMKRQAAKL